jgi:hypothetical protein
MKISIIFRGENVRKCHRDTTRKYIDILMCWNNIQKTIIDDLTKNGHNCEITFITYSSEIIDDIKKIINPKNIYLYEPETQIKNFEQVLQFMDNNKNIYDRFIILRCDFKYRLCITEWPKWNERGIILVNKDVHWPKMKLYADILFIVDTDSIYNFKLAFYSDIFCDTIHGLGRYLYNNISFHLMYEDYYHMDDHPIHSLASLEDEPDLEHIKKINPIKDVSMWNI